MGVRTLGGLGERGLIARLRPRLASRGDVVLGAGDDCAVVGPPGAGEELVLKSDPVREGRHFAAGEDPRRVGRKALARVLSDFASMGAEPRWALVDFSAPQSFPVAAAEALYGGIDELARRWNVAVVGGDTSMSDALELHVFAAGAVPRGSAMTRSGARPGDAVFVTGELGGSYESGRHLDFDPKLDEGRWLRRRGVRCCIDVSDGAASELHRLADASRARFSVRSELLPASAAARAKADPVRSALRDGEDFELLFTVPSGLAAAMERDFSASFPGTPLSRIGEVGEGGGVFLDGAPLPDSGFDHFSSD